MSLMNLVLGSDSIQHIQKLSEERYAEFFRFSMLLFVFLFRYILFLSGKPYFIDEEHLGGCCCVVLLPWVVMH